MTLYLSNFSSKRTPGMHGPGKLYTAMAAPRQWEWGDGRVRALTPAFDEDTQTLLRLALAERSAGVVDGPAMKAYRDAYVAALPANDLAPGRLRAAAGGGLFPIVRDGDTVCCACKRSDRAAGRCHLAWAAPYLVAEGWAVMLDGAEVARPVAAPRDPRRDPQPGDVVQTESYTFEVLPGAAHSLGEIEFQRTERLMPFVSTKIGCALPFWRRDFAKAEIVRVGPA